MRGRVRSDRGQGRRAVGDRRRRAEKVTPMRKLAMVVAVCVVLGLGLVRAAAAAEGKLAILIVSRASDAAMEARAHTLAQDIAATDGYSVDLLPIYFYHFDVAAERRHCEKVLDIGPGDLLFVGVVRPDAAGVPRQVRFRLSGVLDVHGAARQVLEQAYGMLGRTLPSPVPAATPTPTPTPTPEPSPTAVPVPQPSALTRAQQAFYAGQFVEPEGDNTVEWCRQALLANPRDSAAAALEERAAAAAENLAREAQHRQDAVTAIAIYRRLFTLYPDRGAYLTSLEALRSLDLSGTWDWDANRRYQEHFVTVAAPGGTADMQGGVPAKHLHGTWSCVNVEQRTFEFRWEGGKFVDRLTLSQDGSILTGSNNQGSTVHAVRRPSGPPRVVPQGR